MRALRVDIYESKYIGNCSNNGISNRYNSILLVCDEGDVVIDENGELPENLCKLVTRKIGNRTIGYIEPVASPKGCGWMMGGSVCYCSDSRFHEFWDYPLPLHDRCESQELYDKLSR